MSFFKSRMRRAEARTRSSLRCRECGLTSVGMGRIIYSDEIGPETDPDERCAECGRPLFFVIEIAGEEAGRG